MSLGDMERIADRQSSEKCRLAINPIGVSIAHNPDQSAPSAICYLAKSISYENFWLCWQSAANQSLALFREETGNSVKIEPLAPPESQLLPEYQMVSEKFPIRSNREFFRNCRETAQGSSQLTQGFCETWNNIASTDFPTSRHKMYHGRAQ